MSFCSLKNKHLQELMHGKIIPSPNKKIIINALRQNEITDEELLRNANNTFLTPNEFNHALKDLVNRKYALYMHLNISSLSYYRQKLYNLLSSMKTKPKFIGISEIIFHSQIMFMNTHQLNLVKGVHFSTLIKIWNKK